MLGVDKRRYVFFFVIFAFVCVYAGVCPCTCTRTHTCRYAYIHIHMHMEARGQPVVVYCLVSAHLFLKQVLPWHLPSRLGCPASDSQLFLPS